VQEGRNPTAYGGEFHVDGALSHTVGVTVGEGVGEGDRVGEEVEESDSVLLFDMEGEGVRSLECDAGCVSAAEVEADEDTESCIAEDELEVEQGTGVEDPIDAEGTCVAGVCAVAVHAREEEATEERLGFAEHDSVELYDAVEGMDGEGEEAIVKLWVELGEAKELPEPVIAVVAES